MYTVGPVFIPPASMPVHKLRGAEAVPSASVNQFNRLKLTR